jgi:hypothetical protein
VSGGAAFLAAAFTLNGPVEEGGTFSVQGVRTRIPEVRVGNSGWIGSGRRQEDAERLRKRGFWAGRVEERCLLARLLSVEEGGTCFGAKPLGVAAVLAQNPLQKPKKTKKSSAPAFHAASKAVRREFRDAYALFVAAYRTAAEKLRAGIRDVLFPRGRFPPPMPFVSG